VTEDGHEIIQTNGAVAAWQPPQETPELTQAQLDQLIAKTDRMWQETQRRDGNHRWHSHQWMRAFYVMLGVWVGTVGLALWFEFIPIKSLVAMG